MNFKDKKALYKLFLVMTILIVIISLFLPIYVWKDSEKYGIEKYGLSLEIEFSYLVQHRVLKDINKENIEHHIYTFFKLFQISSGDKDLYKEFPVISDYTLENEGFISISFFNIMSFFLIIFSLIFFVYFLYLSIINLEK